MPTAPVEKRSSLQVPFFSTSPTIVSEVDYNEYLSVLELSKRIFYDDLSLSTRIRRTQTQHKSGDIVLMKLE